MIQDQAHSLRQTWRSLEDLQKLVLAGCHGNQAGCSKPLSKLRVKDLRQELRARGVFDVTGKVEELHHILDNILCGAQRVPTLLIHNPAQSLGSLNLQHYTILACEPLHALKGHLHNLFQELPCILHDDLKAECKKLLTTQLSKEKVTGADLRATAIFALTLFKDKGNHDLTLLMDSIVPSLTYTVLPRQ